MLKSLPVIRKDRLYMIIIIKRINKEKRGTTDTPKKENMGLYLLHKKKEETRHNIGGN